jgi:tRNA (adenine57-N1/adenine58-N1)-methyltransferase
LKSDIIFIYPQAYRKLKRGPQVILPKDIGIIMSYTGVNKNSICIDVGTGSGWLALSLSMVAKKVYTYEIREDFIRIAEKNREILGIENIIFKHQDACEYIDEEDADIMTVDIPNAERLLPNAAKAIKKGGMIAGYLPHTEQVGAFVEGLNSTGFSDVHTLEVIVREMLVRREGIRPANMGLMHTAYLTFARKL